MLPLPSYPLLLIQWLLTCIYGRGVICQPWIEKHGDYTGLCNYTQHGGNYSYNNIGRLAAVRFFQPSLFPSVVHLFFRLEIWISEYQFFDSLVLLLIHFRALVHQTNEQPRLGDCCIFPHIFCAKLYLNITQKRLMAHRVMFLIRIFMK